MHSIPALAVGTMFLNDHFFKFYFHNWFTGKLSDFTGLFFFPLFLLACYVLITKHVITKRKILIAILATDLIFIAVKFIPPITKIYLTTLNAIGFRSAVYSDPSDLLALASNFLTYGFIVMVQVKAPSSKQE